MLITKKGKYGLGYQCLLVGLIKSLLVISNMTLYTFSPSPFFFKGSISVFVGDRADGKGGGEREDTEELNKKYFHTGNESL